MKSTILIPTILLSLLACVALAAIPEGQPVARPLSPMMQEITALQESSHLAVAELARSLTDAVSSEQIMEIQREIGRLKSEARVETLRIQLRYAKAEGRSKVAAKLEEVITGLTNPRPSLSQIRPAPVQNQK